MNSEIKCPHCGSAFTVNESEYAILLEQIKATEIAKAVDEKGILGALCGGVNAAACGISAAIFLGFVCSVLFKPKSKE